MRWARDTHWGLGRGCGQGQTRSAWTRGRRDRAGMLSLAETAAVRDCTWGPALEAVAGHRYRRHYSLNPVLWVKDRLKEFLWSKQKEIMYSVRDYRETSVQSCHGIGKSWIAARVVAWWIDSHPPGEAIAVTSA